MQLLKLKISLKLSLAASDIFDYTGFYEQYTYMEKAISYHQIPQQIRVKTLSLQFQLAFQSLARLVFCIIKIRLKAKIGCHCMIQQFPLLAQEKNS